MDIFQYVVTPFTEHLNSGLSTSSRLERTLLNFLMVQIFLNTISEVTGASNSSCTEPTNGSLIIGIDLDLDDFFDLELVDMSDTKTIISRNSKTNVQDAHLKF